MRCSHVALDLIIDLDPWLQHLQSAVPVSVSDGVSVQNCDRLGYSTNCAVSILEGWSLPSLPRLHTVTMGGPVHVLEESGNTECAGP